MYEQRRPGNPITLGLVGLMVVLMAGLAGCISPPPATTPTPSPTATPEPAVSLAELIVTGRGTVECRMQPHGCLASFVIQPGGWRPEPGWEPTPDVPHFGARPFPWTLDDGPAYGAPAALAPGDYTFANAVSEPNDVIGAVDPIVWTRVLCIVDTTIPDNATRVTVVADFDDPCSISVDIVVDPLRTSPP